MMTVLVIEDNDFIFNLINQLLKLNNAIVIRANDIQGTIDILDNMSIDLAIVNAKAPANTDAIQITQSIKSVRATLPVIVTSSSAVPGDVIRSFYAGCDEYITRPILADKFYEAVKKYQNSDIRQTNKAELM
jgi:DNA-binding response OmpR family regulator